LAATLFCSTVRSPPRATPFPYTTLFRSKVRRAGQNALLVLQICLGHRDRAGRGGVISRAGLQQADDLAATRTGALDDGVDPLLRSEEHTSELQSRENLVCRLLLEKNNES